LQSIESKILSRIYGRGRGWAFSQNDFANLGSRSAIDWSMHQLVKKRKIRRVMRGIYDYPKYSEKLNQDLSPNIDKVAQAIARKFNWHIQPSGPAAQNILGLSTQVPGKYSYNSNGPDRNYTIGKTDLSFINTPTKEAEFKIHESAIIVQALKSFKENNITPLTIKTVRKWLNPNLRLKVLNDTRTVTGWVYEAIRKICRENSDG